ncbi:MAG: hypothetical protein ACRDNP_12300 [Gaiellaceae bacterium]
MRKVVGALAAGVAALAIVQAGAARPPTVLELKHFFRGCHVFAKNEKPAVNLRLRKGDRIQLVDHDPMDFDIVQTAGPRVPLADPRLRRSEVRLLVFRKAGLYRFEAANVQTSEELGLQTLGPDNTLKIVVRVA